MKKSLIIISILILSAIAFFLWWAFSPLLYDVEVQDNLDPQIEAELQSENSEGETENTSLKSFPIEHTAGHPASGEVELIQTDDKNLIRFSNYEGTNGPDLYVYLATDLEASEYISLGEQKGNKGNIIYEIPEGVDLSQYQYVLTWCKAFGVLFDYSKIN